MPIYDFQCTQCGHKAELLRKMSEPSTTACPACSQQTLTKMLSAPSFQLNGSGWYATDFKEKKPKSTATASTDNEAKPNNSDSASTTASCAPGCACH
jgi:putative FmdB family regulatory protein